MKVKILEVKLEKITPPEDIALYPVLGYIGVRYECEGNVDSVHIHHSDKVKTPKDLLRRIRESIEFERTRESRERERERQLRSLEKKLKAVEGKEFEV